MSAPQPAADQRPLLQRLNAPQLQERLQALRDIELEALRHQAGPGAEVARRAQRLIARGLPYYAPQDPGYLRWTRKAVGFWAALQGARLVAH